MKTRLVTLLWLFAIALLGLSGDRAGSDAVALREVATQAHHLSSILQAHHALPAGDVTSTDSLRRGHLTMHRSTPGVAKRSALAVEEFAPARAKSLFASVPALESPAAPPLIHNPARAPPA